MLVLRNFNGEYEWCLTCRVAYWCHCETCQVLRSLADTVWRRAW